MVTSQFGGLTQLSRELSAFSFSILVKASDGFRFVLIYTKYALQFNSRKHSSMSLTIALDTLHLQDALIKANTSPKLSTYE